MQCGGSPRVQVQTVDSARSNYVLHMGGTIDGEMTRDPMGYWAYDQYWEPNVSVKLENIGATPVVNPWIQRAGTPDTRNLKALVDSLVRPEMSDKEKARRLWEYEIQTRYHATTQDDEVADAIKRINVYGYTLCYDESKVMSDLWRAAGLKVRKGYPNGHSLAEVYYEGAWHLLDSDESIISLLRDNETIASEAQVVADHDLMKRTHTYGLLANDDRMTDESSAALLYWEGERSGEQPSLTRHSMNFTLRPAEAITWAWNPANRYHAEPFSFGGDDADNWNQRWRVLAHVMDGELSYAPDLSDAKTLQYLQADHVKQIPGMFGSGLYLDGAKGTVDVPVQSAYPVVGGKLDVSFARKDLSGGAVAISISFDEGKTWKPIWSSAPSDYSRMYVDLDPYFRKTDPARYGYVLRFELTSAREAAPVMLKGFFLRSMLQMAPLAMPGVALGDNQFTYSDTSPGARKVRITHTWNECDANVAIPSAPAPASPADGGTVHGTQVHFTWTAGTGQTPSDYEFELSEFPDMRWALSSNFHKLISRTANRGTSSYTLPYPGLLNPGQAYYWRIRARGENEVWGPWSRAASFSAIAPAVPQRVAATFDRARRVAQLTWEAGKGGAEPDHYLIYGSAKRGFSAYDNPHPFNDGLAGIQQAPANLLLEAHGHKAELPHDLWRPYYRVVAVDRAGNVSGVSEVAELPHPLIAGSTLPAGVRGRFYEAQIAVSTSIGHLVSADEDGKSYQMRFRTGDALEFSLSGAPQGLTIDSTGRISGFIEEDAQSHYDLTVRVADKTGGQSDSVRMTLPLEQKRP